MRFFTTLFGASAFASAAMAAISITSAPQGAQAGHTYNIEWSGDTNEPATIVLREGPSSNLQTVLTITTNAVGGKFSWTVPSSLPPAGDYALQITAGSDTNFWSVGSIAGGTGTLSSSASASKSASSSASATTLSSASASKSSSASASSTGSSSSAKSSSASATKSSASSSASSSSAPSSTSSSAATTAAASSSTSAAAAPTGGAAGLKSNAALVLGAAAAMAYLA